MIQHHERCIALAALQFAHLGYTRSFTCVRRSSTTVTGSVVLMLGYGYLLLQGANLLSDGSELLLEVLSPGLIGGLVLPVLGALPDALVIVVSGLGSSAGEAQAQVMHGGSKHASLCCKLCHVRLLLGLRSLYDWARAQHCRLANTEVCQSQNRALMRLKCLPSTV